MTSHPSDRRLVTVESAAQQLQVHTKTILRWIRTGRLRATRIGKAYRIVRGDLDALAGVPQEAGTPASDARVTSIVDVPGVEAEMARTWAIRIPAVLKGRDPTDVPMRADVIYDAERHHLKVILVGPPGDTATLLGAIRVWLDDLSPPA